jgi:hypothetical protein
MAYKRGWRENFFLKVQQYIQRDISVPYWQTFLAWWTQFSPEIINEVEEIVDAQDELSRVNTLEELSGIIHADVSIDKDIPDVKRIIGHIQLLIEEAKTEVDYSNEEDWESDESMVKTT